MGDLCDLLMNFWNEFLPVFVNILLNILLSNVFCFLKLKYIRNPVNFAEKYYPQKVNSYCWIVVLAAKLSKDVTTPTQTALCVQRSMEDIAATTRLVTRSPVYIGEPVYVLVLRQTFWNGLDYYITFTDNQELRRIDNHAASGSGSLPAWATRGQFVSSTESDNGSQIISTDGVVWTAVTHRYALAGTHVIKLLISGQLTLRGPILLAEIAVNVVVRDWPSLSDVIGHVTLAGQSQQAYVNESVKFVYAVERIDQNVSYRVHFGNERETMVTETHLYILIYLDVNNIQALQSQKFENIGRHSIELVS